MFDVDGDEVDALDPSCAGEGGDTIEETDTTVKAAVHPDGDVLDVAEANDEDTEVVEITHPVSRSDTLLMIARRYATDVSPQAFIHRLGY